MKTGLIHISALALTKLIGLKEPCIVDAVFQAASDMQSDTFSIRVRGIGQDYAEGSAIRYLSAEEIEAARNPTEAAR